MNTIKVRDIEIGAGAPKIIVPIVGVTKKDIIEEARTFDSIPVDMVEWRVDWFEGVFDFAQVEDTLKDLREALGNTPILMTFRTSKEGGEKAIEPEAYAELNLKAAATGYIDFIDVEIFTGDDIVRKIIDGAHEVGVKVIASNLLQNQILSTVSAKCRIWVLIFQRSLLCLKTPKMSLLFWLQQKKWQPTMLTVRSSPCP